MDLETKLNQALDDIVIKEGSLVFYCRESSVSCGFIQTPDGRQAEVQLIVQADPEFWMGKPLKDSK